jgi:uncharacterized protein YkwD
MGHSTATTVGRNPIGGSVFQEGQQQMDRIFQNSASTSFPFAQLPAIPFITLLLIPLIFSSGQAATDTTPTASISSPEQPGGKTDSQPANPSAKAAPELELHPIEQSLIEQVNGQRARYGLPPLQVCPKLQASARRHCRWMASHGILQHTWEPVAENIAMGQANVREAIRSWMSSPGHRANILGAYRWVGAAAYKSARGTIYWCLQFRR